MKCRNGFVSNSSSSSFIIGCKTKPTESQILQALKVEKSSLLYGFAKQLASVMSNVEELTKEEIIENWGEVPEEHQNILDQGFKIFEGTAESDGDNPAELALVDMKIDYKDENIIILKEEGY